LSNILASEATMRMNRVSFAVNGANSRSYQTSRDLLPSSDTEEGLHTPPSDTENQRPCVRKRKRSGNRSRYVRHTAREEEEEELQQEGEEDEDDDEDEDEVLTH
jgi:hypothetical protein